MTKQIKRFQFINVNEEKSKIKYSGVENKGERPYLVIKCNIKGGYFLAVPLTGKMSSPYGSTKNKGKYWIEYKLDKESYIKLDHFVLFENSELDVNIKIRNQFINANLRKLIIKNIIDFLK